MLGASAQRRLRQHAKGLQGRLVPQTGKLLCLNIALSSIPVNLALSIDTSLCSRKSFFGGSISTRAEAADPGYKARAQAASETSQRTHSKPERHKGAKDSGQQTRKPAAKRPRDSADDFGNLDDNDPLPSKPAGSIKASKVWSPSQPTYHAMCRDEACLWHEHNMAHALYSNVAARGSILHGTCLCLHLRYKRMQDTVSALLCHGMCAEKGLAWCAHNAQGRRVHYVQCAK